MTHPKHDNITLDQKVMLRQTALRLLGGEPPVILETHGGHGDVWSSLYHPFDGGVVFEKDHDRSVELASQRPTWAVYEADVELALPAGAARHLAFNYVDVDPWGSCWETLAGFFSSARPLAGRMVLVVNDGLRHNLRGGKGWQTGASEGIVRKYGNHNAFRLYPDVVEEMLASTVAGVYRITHFESYATGHEKKMVHFLAVLERDA